MVEQRRCRLACRIAAAHLVSVASLLVGAAAAQDFPSRPLRLIVPLPPGGSNDLVARVFSEKLPAGLGQPLVVENRPGGSGNIATEFVARSAPDGHTLLLANTGHVINAAFFATLPYDPIADFSGVTLAYNVFFALVVIPEIPAKSVQEFVDYAKANPGKLTYASAGIGQPHHLAMEMLQSMTGAKLLHVPYKGAGQFVPALLSGEVQSVIGAINSLLPHVRAGKLRALGMAGERQTPLLPGVPTISEAGLKGFNLDNWTGVVAPSRTPRPVVQRLNAEFVKALRAPDVMERLSPQGIEVVASSSEAFDASLKAALMKWVKLVKEAGIRIEQ